MDDDELHSAPFGISHADVIESARRGMKHSATATHAELKRGLSSLATIGSTAPLIGLFGTVVGIVNAFVGCGAEKSLCLAAEAAGISKALVTTALGLFVALPTVYCYNYFTNRLERFDVEMEHSSIELINCLIIYVARQANRTGH